MTKGRLLVSYYYSYVDIKLEHKLQTYGSDQRDPFFCVASSKGVEGREGWKIRAILFVDRGAQKVEIFRNYCI